MNKVCLVGRLARDPELRFAAGSGTAVCRFTLAVNRTFEKDKADFIGCVVFGKRAEALSQYLTKGSQVAVDGRIQTGSYDKEDGTKVYTTDVVIDNFTFCGSSSNSNSQNQNEYGDITPVDEDAPF